MPTGTVGTTARRYQTSQVHYLRKRITFADDGLTVTLGIIPANSFVVRAGVVVTEAFNAATTNVLDIGTSADSDGFATDLALGTVGVIVADEMATTNDAFVSADTTLVCVVDLTGTAATTGVGYVWVEFLPDLG